MRHDPFGVSGQRRDVEDQETISRSPDREISRASKQNQRGVSTVGCVRLRRALRDRIAEEMRARLR